MKTKFKVLIIILIGIIMMFPIISTAITETDNGIMAVYIRNKGMSTGLEMGDDLKGFDIKGYITTNEATNEKTLISSTYSDYGYHVFLNVNGINGEMDATLSEADEEKLKAMQYTAYSTSDGWQTINGINLKVSTQFINNGEQLQIIYDVKNPTSEAATISLATAADVQIDNDDKATIERLDDASGVRLWTKEGETEKPVQFVLYGKNVTGTTDIDNIYLGTWGGGDYLKYMYASNTGTNKIEDRDSAFSYAWVNRTINAGETKRYTVLMEVGEINIPNTGLILDNNTKFYYKDVKINGTVIDKDLKDKITIHYSVDGTEYTLPEMATNGTSKEFTLDLTSLNLSAVTPHNLKVWATDSTDCESNVEERTFTITYLKEPEVSLSTTEWSKNVTFKITDTINEQQYVSKYQYRINDGTWTDCSKDTDIAIQENGNIKVDVRIVGTKTDDYSNIVTVNAKVDSENPTTTKPTATKTTCSITASLTQTDAHSGIDTTQTRYAIKKDGVWSEWQNSNVFTGLTHNTQYTIKTKVVDKAGNTSESEELTVKTDELLLGNLILKLNNSNGNNYTEDTWTNQNIYVAIEERSIGATTKYKSKENSAQNITETNQETTITTTGETIITLSVTDGTNTIISDIEHILKVDKVDPIITKLLLDDDDWSKENKNITGEANDDLSGITAYQFSSEENLTTSSSGWIAITATNDKITQTKEIDENGKIYFYVRDAAGNIASVGIDTKIDSQGPVINFSRVNGKTAINVTDTGAGIKTTQYAWTTQNSEPTNWQNYSSAITYSGSNTGKIYLWAKSVDNIGNTTITSSAFSEIKAPTIISEDEFVNKNITFKLTAENVDDDVLYQFKINDGEWQNITKDSIHTITDITEGQVTISARILDNAGRYSEITSKTVTVSVVEVPTQDDNTTATGTIPQTGMNNVITIALMSVLIIGAVIACGKIIIYKDIK